MQPLTPNQASVLTERTESIFQGQIYSNHQRTDRMFAWLMMLQWLAGIVAALWISPTAWEGQSSHTHIHVWAAIFLGGLISGFPRVSGANSARIGPDPTSDRGSSNVELRFADSFDRRTH